MISKSPLFIRNLAACEAGWPFDLRAGKNILFSGLIPDQCQLKCSPKSKQSVMTLWSSGWTISSKAFPKKSAGVYCSIGVILNKKTGHPRNRNREIF